MASRLKKRFLPVEPTLSPLVLLKVAGKAQAAFPFDSPRRYWYFFARNALWHGLKLLGLEQGDEVLLPAYNHGVEVSAIIDRGLTPRFFRVNRCLEADVEHLRSLISPKTKAVLVIHYMGFPQPLSELQAICQENSLWLIEDCAQALFSRDGETALGSTGVFSIFCLYKTLPLPHGGLLALNDAALPAPPPTRAPGPASALSFMPRHLFDNLEMRAPGAGGWLRRNVLSRASGGLARMNAGRIHVGLEDFDRSQVDLGASSLTRRLTEKANAAKVIEARRRNYLALMSLLPKERQLWRDLPPGVCPLLFPVLVEDKHSAISELERKGIQAIPFWSLAHAAIPAGDFPDSDYLRAHVLEVPIHQDIRLEEIDYLATALQPIHAPS